jgi:hypothetical protein
VSSDGDFLIRLEERKIYNYVLVWMESSHCLKRQASQTQGQKDSAVTVVKADINDRRHPLPEVAAALIGKRRTLWGNC